MKRKILWMLLFVTPLAIGGLVYAGLQRDRDGRSNEGGFICPLTGEELPCPHCCPLN